MELTIRMLFKNSLKSFRISILSFCVLNLKNGIFFSFPFNSLSSLTFETTKYVITPPRTRTATTVRTIPTTVETVDGFIYSNDDDLKNILNKILAG